ncbi:MAG: winged helix-turn-helix domain-containing protein [Methanomethylovorans sp.]|uniref:helix-turn-helix transcriptional regulator n=1 Tax=Methanomethylovorans sp. TaxID=2758717 RepID=UPI00345B3E0B
MTNIVWYSEKRKNILLLLKEGPRDIDRIKTSLNETSRSIMPQIKRLLQKKLIVQNGESYCLSEIGELIVDSIEPLLDTMRVIEENKEFWITRDLSFLPQHLFNRLGELGHYLLVEPDLNRMFELPREFKNNILKSKQVSSFISYVHPQIPSLYIELVDKGVHLSLFMTKTAFEKLKSEYPKEMKKILSSSGVELFLCNENIPLPTLAVTGWFTYLCFLNVEGRYDHWDIISFDESALLWGNELIEHYRSKSERIHFS